MGDLTRKLAMLLALASANRSSDLAKFSVFHCQVMPHKAVFFQQTCANRIVLVINVQHSLFWHLKAMTSSAHSNV